MLGAHPTQLPTKCGKRTRRCKVCGEWRKHHLDKDHEFEAKLCIKSPMPNGCCELHGGKSLSGIAHPNYQGKGFSKVSILPTRMRADYEAIRNAPDRLSLESEIAEMRTLHADIWRMLEADGLIAVQQVRSAASEIHKHYLAARAANQSGNAEKFVEAMIGLGEADRNMSDALSQVASEEYARDKAADLMIKTEKLLKSENARIMDERGMVSLEAALADRHTLVQALLKAVVNNVRDAEVQKAIRRTVSSEYARLTGRRDPAHAAPAGGPSIIDVEHSESAD